MGSGLARAVQAELSSRDPSRDALEPDSEIHSTGRKGRCRRPLVCARRNPAVRAWPPLRHLVCAARRHPLGTGQAVTDVAAHVRAWRRGNQHVYDNNMIMMRIFVLRIEGVYF